MTTTIPLLPNNIVVGLQNDLIQYVIELKFLLLFFEKPVALLDNIAGQFIDEQAVDDARNGRKPKTSMFSLLNDEDDDSGILFDSLLGTDEWSELLLNCTPHFVTHELNQVEGSELDHISHEAREVVLFEFGDEASFHESIKNEPYDTRMMMAIGRSAAISGIDRFISLMNVCEVKNAPMLWASPNELWITRIYSKFLIEKNRKENFSREYVKSFRQINGHKLLREIFNLEIANVYNIPISAIIEFRSRNADLLSSFLTHYRGFLSSLQSEPEKIDLLIEARTQEIAKDINTINAELAILRNNRGYKWLKTLSSDAYDKASKGTPAAIWGLLSNPLVTAMHLGMELAQLGGKLVGIQLESNEMEKALLIRNNNAYLWKAKETFKPSA